MSIIPIYNCFHPFLRKKTTLINNIDDEIVKLVDDMFETMYKADGIGLAANQVGKPISLIIIDVSKADDKVKTPPIALINPIIESFSEEEIEISEGCLSIPKFYEKVLRPEEIQVKYFDLSMKEHVLTGNEMLSRVIQHEVDHLNGILFFERLTPMRRALAKSKLKAIQKGKIDANYPFINPDGKPANI